MVLQNAKITDGTRAIAMPFVIGIPLSTLPGVREGPEVTFQMMRFPELADSFRQLPGSQGRATSSTCADFETGSITVKSLVSLR